MAMNRRNFLRGLGAAVVLAATSSYGKLGATTKLELKLKTAGPAQFAYHEAAPSFIKWTARTGAGVNLPYGVVRPSDVIIEYKRAVETVVTFDDAAYGGAAGGGLKFEHGIRREFLEALESTKGNPHLTDKGKVSTFKGVRRAFLELFK